MELTCGTEADTREIKATVQGQSVAGSKEI